PQGGPLMFRRLLLVLGCAAFFAAGAARADAPTADSPDKKLIARAEGKAVILVDAATQRIVAKMLGHTGNVRARAFSPDGKLLAPGADAKAVAVWDGATGRQLRRFVVADPVKKVSFSQDGKTLTVEDAAGKKTNFDLATGQEVK